MIVEQLFLTAQPCVHATNKRWKTTVGAQRRPVAIERRIALIGVNVFARDRTRNGECGVSGGIGWQTIIADAANIAISQDAPVDTSNTKAIEQRPHHRSGSTISAERPTANANREISADLMDANRSRDSTYRKTCAYTRYTRRHFK